MRKTMKYWRINTDSTAREDVKTCDVWYKERKAFAGDFAETKRRHDKIFEKFSPGDGVFMHHSQLGVVGYGVVSEEWDGETYKGEKRKLYKQEDFEYRIAVDWVSDLDCRNNPFPINGVLPYLGTYSQVDPTKWNVNLVVEELRSRAR
jgi:hypothetical protein